MWRETAWIPGTRWTVIYISIHSLRVEGDWTRSARLPTISNFNPLPPCGGRPPHPHNAGGGRHFNPLPPCGGRPVSRYTPARARIYFNPLPPCGGRRFWFRFGVYSEQFQSTPSVWRETAAKRTAMPQYPISIHSLRVEGDCDNIFFCRRRKDFNPLPPCGGRLLPQYSALVVTRFQSTPSVWRETMDGSGVYQRLRFQSTPSVWRETVGNIGTCQAYAYFNPLPPCGGRQKSLCNVSAGDAISIHSLRVEGDSSWYNIISTRHRFQSTPSVWRETTLYRIYSTQEDISIHSLRVEGDTLQRIADTLNAISIHSLRVEGDTINSLCSISSAYFNPLPPCGGRQINISEIRR